MYAVYLTGVGPRRAMAERVTHIVYMVQVQGDCVTILSFDNLSQCLTTCGVHHTVHTRPEGEFVSVSVPKLPRNYAISIAGLLYPLEADDEPTARNRVVEWCKEHAVGTGMKI